MVQVPAASEVLSTLRHEHPRLLVRADAFDRLGQMIQSDAMIAKRYRQVRKEADKLLTEPVSHYDIPDGRRLLSVSRRVLGRALTLGLVWRIEHDDKYAERLWRELKAVCAFKDWNPSHFLDTAEMTAAVAVGYDWLFDHWTAEQRATLRTGILTHGLTPAKKVYDQREWWSKSENNWNQVCNGGIGMGALAIADEEPAFAAETIHNAAMSLPLAIASYGPDGAWSEGPGYWNYATMYTTFILSSMQCSLDTDFGLSDIPGLNLAGDMPIYFTAPTGMTFNFADAHETVSDGPSLFWLAHRYHTPRYAHHRLQLLQHGKRAEPLDLLWYDPQWASFTPDALPTAHYFRGTEVVSIRSSWTDPDATFVGLKAGDNQAGHSNLDLGSFILESQGQRFAIDLGPDDYNLPEYFGKQRWNYYRMRAEGHNTLVINSDHTPDQQPKAVARISDFAATPDRTAASIDLTPAYLDHGAQHVRRTVTVAGKIVTITDEIRLENPGEIWWFWHTHAQIQIAGDGRSATLTQGGKHLTLQLQSPVDARFTVMDAAPLATSPHPLGQNPNNGAKLTNASPAHGMVAVGTLPQFGPPDPAHAVRKLAVRMTGVAQTGITVIARPQ